MKLAILIRTYREAQRLSLRKLGKLIGVSSSVLHRFEHDKPISGGHWAKIAKWALTE